MIGEITHGSEIESRIMEVEEEIDSLHCQIQEVEEEEFNEENCSKIQMLEDELQEFELELDGLKDLKESCGENYPNVSLIHESSFLDHIRDTAYDCGMVSLDLDSYVDWDKYAEDCRMDYFSVEYDYETYYIRS